MRKDSMLTGSIRQQKTETPIVNPVAEYLQTKEDDALLALAVRLGLGVAENEQRDNLINRIAELEVLQGKSDDELEVVFAAAAEPAEPAAEEAVEGEQNAAEEAAETTPEGEGTAETENATETPDTKPAA